MVNIKELVKGNIAEFYKLRHGIAYYWVECYLFPVPLEDIQDATLYRKEKAIHLMRYIRKAKEEGTLIKITGELDG